LNTLLSDHSVNVSCESVQQSEPRIIQVCNGTRKCENPDSSGTVSREPVPRMGTT